MTIYSFEKWVTMSVKTQLDFKKLEKVAEILKAVAHPIRIQIIELLGQKEELTVSEIYGALGSEQSLTSHHLTKMKDKGVLNCRRYGKNIYYSLADDKITQVIDCIENCDL